MFEGTPIVEEFETRDCPHYSCHGNLKPRDDADGLVCPSCHCTPDGTYIEPEQREHSKSGFYEPTWIEQLQDKYGDRITYRISRYVRLVGGFEEPWPHEMVSRDGRLISGPGITL